MRLITFRTSPDSAPVAGLLANDRAWPLSGAGFPSLLAVAAQGRAGVARIEEAFSRNELGSGHDAGAVSLLAPIPRPPKLICIGLNYRDHALESNMEIPPVPTVFNKFPNCVIAPGEPIVLPRVSEKPDYEAELAVVIGPGGRNIPAERWQEHVFGYTILNDVSARDYQMRTSQWLLGKTFDTFAPMGPYLVTADEVADPHALDIQLEIHGEVLQSSNTRHLIFRIPELIAELSRVTTLEPGDVISTGTPAGVGFARKPPRFLRPGDEVAITISGLGTLRNPVTAES